MSGDQSGLLTQQLAVASTQRTAPPSVDVQTMTAFEVV